MPVGLPERDLQRCKSQEFCFIGILLFASL